MKKQYALLAAVFTLPLMQAGCRPDSGSDDRGTKIAVEVDSESSGETDGLNDDSAEETSQTDKEDWDSYFREDPDSKRVRMAMRNRNFDFYISNYDGTELKWLAYSPADELAPVLSRDGSKIAFMSNRDGNWDIYVMNADGTEQTNLTNNPAEDEIPGISPDGSKVVFSSVRDGKQELYIVNSDGTGQMQLTNKGGQDWRSPFLNVFLIPPSFNLDGSKIVFVSNRDGNNEIYIMNTDGSEQRNLTKSAGEEDSPQFTIDGSKIRFRVDDGDRGNWYFMNPDGSDVTSLDDRAAYLFGLLRVRWESDLRRQG